jgi:nucleoside-diphosphate-sugar epimerase
MATGQADAAAPRKTALVIGGVGVIGRNLVNHLSALPDWDILAVSRRTPDFSSRARFLSVDLHDRGQACERLGGLTEITHIFYTALDGGLAASNTTRNLALLANAVDAVAPVAKGLQRIVLMQGGKAYGRHIRGFKTPAKETDPRHMPPNFYYDQEDYIRALQVGKAWTWSALRPESVLGFSVGNPLNLLNVIAVYAVISKELGLPLVYPGSPLAYHTLMQATDSDLLARAQCWAATAPNAANEAYNVTNGDVFRFEQVWPRFADFFGMKTGQPLHLSLVEVMADKAPVWDHIVARHRLRPQAYADVANWEFGDFTFHTDWDLILADGKRFRAGFTETLDTEERFLELFQQLRDENVIPRA